MVFTTLAAPKLNRNIDQCYDFCLGLVISPILPLNAPVGRRHARKPSREQTSNAAPLKYTEQVPKPILKRKSVAVRELKGVF